MKQPLQIATFAAGCFWGVEETFRKLPGVQETAVGYTGGRLPNATYENVCGGGTGHAEAVQIQYDPSKISYEALLKVFWENHNPTTLNAQGPDTGSQYRSAIFFHTPAQKLAAQLSKETLQKSAQWGGRKIVTEITAAGPFYRAEEYHQKYLMKRGAESCRI